jgi:hypothetical protein
MNHKYRKNKTASAGFNASSSKGYTYISKVIIKLMNGRLRKPAVEYILGFGIGINCLFCVEVEYSAVY